MKNLALALAAGSLAWFGLPPPRVPPQPRLGQLVALVQDIREDYYEASEVGTAQAHRHVTESADAVVALARGEPEAADLVAPLEQFRADVRRQVQPPRIAAQANALVTRLAVQRRIATSPPQPPNLHRASMLYGAICAACHGAAGRDGNAAAFMSPRPTDLVADGNINPLSPFRVFEAITYGMAGTAMPSFELVPENDRWSLAFYVFTLRGGACAGPRPQVSIEQLATTTDSVLAAEYGERNLPCLRRFPDAVSEAP